MLHALSLCPAQEHLALKGNQVTPGGHNTNLIQSFQSFSPVCTMHTTITELHDFSIGMAECTHYYATGIHVRPHAALQCCNHMSDCSVQCAIGTKNSQATVTVERLGLACLDFSAYIYTRLSQWIHWLHSSNCINCACSQLCLSVIWQVC